MDIAMEVRNLSFSYGKNKVLKNISLSIEKGKITTIMGANGCGKSTLFSIMTRNLMPARGKILLYGENAWRMTPLEFARNVSIVHQYNTAADDITVKRLVAFGRTPYQRVFGGLREEDRRMIDRAIRITGLEEYRDREIAGLSGGQRQRVWIAMALAQNTDILFLDEPTTYLDIRYQLEILELVRRLNEQFGITIVMVLHDINQAIEFSHICIGLKDGKVVMDTKPENGITQDIIEQMYGIRLGVGQIDGHTYVDTSKPLDRKCINFSLEQEGGQMEEKKSVSEVETTSDDIGKNPLRILWLLLGILCLGLGTVGVVLPILPTVPFYLATVFCFAKSSKRLHDWFLGTNLYKKNLRTFVEDRSMTMATKIRIIVTVTILMGVGFAMMGRVPAGRVILAIVWVAHLWYFIFRVETRKKKEQKE